MTDDPTTVGSVPDGDGSGITYAILGPLDVRRDGSPLKIGGPKARALLGMLLLDADRVVSSSRLIEGIWGEDAPMGVQATLQVHVSNLRKVLGPGTLLTRSPGYLIEVDPTCFDLARFDARVAEGRALMDAGDPPGARRALADALALWRGPALADVVDAPFVESAVPWLAERRNLALEEHAEASLAAGAHRELVAELEAAVGEAPHRERLWGQLMVALYRSDRQADALSTYQRARRVLGEDLGIDPGPELRRLEAAVLAQDPSLDLAAPSPAAGPDDGDPGATYRAPVQHHCRLVLENGDEIALEGVTCIGRHPDCELTLPDVAVSRRHVELRPALGGYLLVDLGSTNGTLVNDAPVLQHLLADGDVIRVGAHLIRYRADTL